MPASVLAVASAGQYNPNLSYNITLVAGADEGLFGVVTASLTFIATALNFDTVAAALEDDTSSSSGVGGGLFYLDQGSIATGIRAVDIANIDYRIASVALQIGGLDLVSINAAFPTVSNSFVDSGTALSVDPGAAGADDITLIYITWQDTRVSVSSASGVQQADQESGASDLFHTRTNVRVVSGTRSGNVTATLSSASNDRAFIHAVVLPGLAAAGGSSGNSTYHYRQRRRGRV